MARPVRVFVPTSGADYWTARSYVLNTRASCCSSPSPQSKQLLSEADVSAEQVMRLLQAMAQATPATETSFSNSMVMFAGQLRDLLLGFNGKCIELLQVSGGRGPMGSCVGGRDCGGMEAGWGRCLRVIFRGLGGF